MTTPTQAQIKAAAKAIEAATISLKDFSKWSEVAATAALTAPTAQDVKGILRDDWLHPATVERCAQVAESFADGESIEDVGLIAAAIRALKDK